MCQQHCCKGTFAPKLSWGHHLLSKSISLHFPEPQGIQVRKWSRNHLSLWCWSWCAWGPLCELDDSIRAMSSYSDQRELHGNHWRWLFLNHTAMQNLPWPRNGQGCLWWHKGGDGACRGSWCSLRALLWYQLLLRSCVGSSWRHQALRHGFGRKGSQQQERTPGSPWRCGRLSSLFKSWVAFWPWHPGCCNTGDARWQAGQDLCNRRGLMPTRGKGLQHGHCWPFSLRVPWLI